MMSVSWVGILPYTYPPYYEACVATMSDEFKQNVLFVNNTDPAENIGCMASHNVGIRFMYERGADWLIIMSPAIRFGATGGMDFVRVLEEHSDYYVLHAATENVPGGRQHINVGAEGEKNGVWGWHLTAFHRRVFDAVGGFDTNFSPYNLDDVDLSLRIQKHFRGAPGWDTFPTDVTDTIMAHTINLTGLSSPYAPRDDYLLAKWGRRGADWQEMGWEHPFNDESKPLSWWPEPPDPRAYNNGYWERVKASEHWDLSGGHVNQ